MKALALYILLALSAFCSTNLNYEPIEVTVHGVVRRQTFPGRPNYEDIAKGDEPETYWILELDQPVDVIGAKESEIDVTELGVRSLQLVFGVLNEKSYANYPGFVGAHVTVVGQLFHSITAHHKTDVLISVRDMKKALYEASESTTPNGHRE